MQQIIAIPTYDGVLFPHFGKAPQLTVFTITDGRITVSQTLTAPEHEHGSMPRFIQSCGCTDVICGGLGFHAIGMLSSMGITVHSGAPSLPVTEIIARYLDGTLEYGDGSCSHEGCGGHQHKGNGIVQ